MQHENKPLLLSPRGRFSHSHVKNRSLRGIVIRFWQGSDLYHLAFLAFRTRGYVYAGQPKHHLNNCFVAFLRQFCLWVNQFSKKRDSLFFVPVGQEPEVADLHEAFWQDMEQKASDKFICGQGHYFDRLTSFRIPIGKNHLAVCNG